LGSVLATSEASLPRLAESGLVFVSRWGEPLYPDTVTALMTKLINQHNKSVTHN
jgi:hypothetical protein